MTIKNQTQWLTRDLKRIFSVILRKNVKIERKLRITQNLIIEVVYSRLGKYSGWAQYDGVVMHLRIPKERIDGDHLAHLFEHELEHIYGYHHKKMGLTHLEKFSWAKNPEKFPLRRKVQKLTIPP